MEQTVATYKPLTSGQLEWIDQKISQQVPDLVEQPDESGEYSFETKPIKLIDGRKVIAEITYRFDYSTRNPKYFEDTGFEYDENKQVELSQSIVQTIVAGVVKDEIFPELKLTEKILQNLIQ